jgi:hypothetical protein
MNSNNNEKIDYRMSVPNIMEIMRISDLKKIMSTCETVIMGFTVSETPTGLKNIIRKFLKRKAEIFRLITFVYMEVSETDRRVLNILSGSDETFPKIYHIRNGEDILVSVQAANAESIVESFKAVEKYYINEMKDFQKQFSEMKKKRNPSLSQDNASEQDQEREQEQKEEPDDAKNTSESDQEKQKEETIDDQTKMNAMNMNENENLQESKEDPFLNKKMNLEKLVHVNKTYDDMKINLLRDITKRKKIECKNNEKKESEKKKDDGAEYRKLRKKR